MRLKPVRSMIRQLGFIVIGTVLAQGVAHAMSIREQSEILQQIKTAYAQGNIQSFTQLSNQLPNDSLFRPYVQVWAFRLAQKNSNPNETENVWPPGVIIPVLNSVENSWPGEGLRRQWLGQLARTGKWAQYSEQRALLRYRPDADIECADLLQSVEQGTWMPSRIMDLISQDAKLPKTCRFLVYTLYNRKAISPNWLDLRLLNLISNNKLDSAVDFLQEFQDTRWGQSIDASTLRNAANKPEKFLKNYKKDNYKSDVYLAAALAQITRSDSDGVAEYLQQQLGNQLSDFNKAWLWAEVAWRKALEWNPKAREYYNNSNVEVMNLEQKEWRVRAALYAEDWADVLQAINKLPTERQSDETWLYWSGRAFAALGNIEQARKNWVRIAQPFSFYGKLAQEELGDVAGSTLVKSRNLTTEEMAQINANPGLQRALALYNVGMKTEGFWEFNLQIAQMNDRQLLAAASWANRNELYDRAIAAADRTREEHDLSLRYLTPYRDNMEAQTRATGIDTSWVYGLIRQESRFNTIAKSGVGASGLMQVMPATARYVAKKMGLSSWSHDDINNINSNLLLGTNYLKMVYEQLDNSPVLASAGYNAGPGRPSSWKKRLGTRAIEGALFTELIPFDETRTYVKHVMSNTVAYSMLLNNASVPLKQRLGTIKNP